MQSRLRNGQLILMYLKKTNGQKGDFNGYLERTLQHVVEEIENNGKH